MSEKDLSNQNNTSLASPDSAAIAKLIYILYLVAIVIGLTALVGMIMAYVYKDEAPDWVRSHYRFQIRTFWIAAALNLLGFFTIFAFIGWGIFLFVFFWYIIRCVKGIQCLNNSQAIPNPGSWMFGE